MKFNILLLLGILLITTSCKQDKSAANKTDDLSSDIATEETEKPKLRIDVEEKNFTKIYNERTSQTQFEASGNTTIDGLIPLIDMNNDSIDSYLNSLKSNWVFAPTNDGKVTYKLFHSKQAIIIDKGEKLTYFNHSEDQSPHFTYLMENNFFEQADDSKVTYFFNYGNNKIHFYQDTSNNASTMIIRAPKKEKK